MGNFVNPNNSAFDVALNSEIYVDKTGLLSYTNRVMDTNDAFLCNSRPRRFGKSITANMLTAYYSKGCDSTALFRGRRISEDNSFCKHLNKYNVIHFDVQWCRVDAGSANATVSYIVEHVITELKDLYPEIITDNVKTLPNALMTINNATGQKFIFIIDEWDVLIRDEAENAAVQEEYINLLRGLFKGTQPTRFIHLAFLTGILPIKKIRTQSALNNFTEFTMLDAKILAPYVGFTQDEVLELSQKYSRDFAEVKRWYDGYLLSDEQVYNPEAVVSVMRWGKFQSYWSQTGTYESIQPLINRDFDGLRTAIITMLSGEPVEVRTKSYQNDMITFKNKDDVLTVLIHLGYLAYDEINKTAYIPNEEIRSELFEAVEDNQWNELVDLQNKSEKVLRATLDMDGVAVAEMIEEFHMDYASSIKYNDENSLSSVLSMAYLSAMKYYFKPIRELPAGKGFSDIVLLPRIAYMELPALLIELKWNKSADTAIQQVKDKNYTRTLESYSGNILLVGIDYNKKSKKHQCQIEKFEK